MTARGGPGPADLTPSAAGRGAAGSEKVGQQVQAPAAELAGQLHARDEREPGAGDGGASSCPANRVSGREGHIVQAGPAGGAADLGRGIGPVEAVL